MHWLDLNKIVARYRGSEKRDVKRQGGDASEGK
jgi:hypothetical protein